MLNINAMLTELTSHGNIYFFTDHSAYGAIDLTLVSITSTKEVIDAVILSHLTGYVVESQVDGTQYKCSCNIV